MSDLLSLLNLGASALSAQNSGVAVAANNVANANTEGYSRQRVDLEALVGPPLSGGVRSGATTRDGSALLDGRIRDASASLGRTSTTRDALAELESTLASGPQLTDRLASVFARMGQVAAAPTDPDQRAAAVAALGDLASAFHTTAGTIADARTAADQQVGTLAASATALASQLAAANRVVATSRDPAALDQRDRIATQLTAIVGGHGRIDPDGQMRFALDDGSTLVDGAHAGTLTATPDTTTGLAKLTFVDGMLSRDVTQSVSGGQLGGTLAARAQIVDLGTQVDQLAVDVATGFNSVSTANAGADGVSGRAAFVAPTSVAGAAAALAIDPGLAADPGQLATAAPGAGPGDNTGARALAALADATVASGGTRTLGEAALAPATALAQRVAGAKSDAATDQVVAAHLGDLRDSIAGVDLTEEQTNLARFSSASQALSKFLATINDMLSSVIANL